MRRKDFDAFEQRHADAARDLSATRREREVQFNRYIGWLFSAAFVILLLLVAVLTAAVRWLWLACAS